MVSRGHAMLFKGIGSSLGVVAYADMVIGIDPDDDVLQATVVALNNAAYSVGWGVGPILGGGLLNVFDGDDADRFAGYCAVVATIAALYGAILRGAPRRCRRGPHGSKDVSVSENEGACRRRGRV